MLVEATHEPAEVPSLGRTPDADSTVLGAEHEGPEPSASAETQDEGIRDTQEAVQEIVGESSSPSETEDDTQDDALRAVDGSLEAPDANPRAESASCEISDVWGVSDTQVAPPEASPVSTSLGPFEALPLQVTRKAPEVSAEPVLIDARTPHEILNPTPPGGQGYPGETIDRVVSSYGAKEGKRPRRTPSSPMELLGFYLKGNKRITVVNEVGGVPFIISRDMAVRWSGRQRRISMPWRLRDRETGKDLAFTSSGETLAALLETTTSVVHELRKEESDVRGAAIDLLRFQTELTPKKVQLLIKLTFD